VISTFIFLLFGGRTRTVPHSWNEPVDWFRFRFRKSSVYEEVSRMKEEQFYMKSPSTVYHSKNVNLK